MLEIYGFATWLSRPARILYTNNWHPTQPEHVPAALRDERITHIWLAGRTLKSVTQAHDQYQRLRELLPNWRHIIGTPDRLLLTSTVGGSEWLAFFHDHMVIDPTRWDMHEDAVKHYDAVLQAAYSPVKRHWLAETVRNLLVIAYKWDAHDPAAQIYAEQMQARLRYAMWANKTGELIDQYTVNWYLSQSRVGLALSASEGGCRAVAEYALCGLPTVTTRCEGGRMSLIDPAFMQIVPPTQEAIVAAVQSFLTEPVDPVDVRDSFIRNQRIARNEFESYLDNLCDWTGITADYTHMPSLTHAGAA